MQEYLGMWCSEYTPIIAVIVPAAIKRNGYVIISSVPQTQERLLMSVCMN